MSENEHRCYRDKEIGALIEASTNFKDFMKDLKDNHLKSIYTKLDCIFKKLGNRRPSWPVLWIIAFLTTTCGVLITALLRKG